MNERLILRALMSIIEKLYSGYGEMYPEVYSDMEEAINPKEEEPSLASKTKDALRRSSE